MPSRLETYLDDVSRPVPIHERESWREEVRQHLDALAAAHRELGLSEDAAMEAALQSFGKANQIGTKVAREAGAVSILTAVRHFALPIVPGFVAIGALMALYGTVDGDWLPGALYGAARFLCAPLLVVSPMLGGMNLGLKLNDHASLRQVLIAAGVAALGTLPAGLLFSIVSNPALRPAPHELILWVLMSVFAAGIGHPTVWARLRKRAMGRPTP